MPKEIRECQAEDCDNRFTINKWNQIYCCHACQRRQASRNLRKNSINATISRMLCAARRRAREKGLECTIEKCHIVIPKTCPILGILIAIGLGAYHDSTPSIDRIDSGKGYTPDNIQIISYRANVLKSNMTPEESILLSKYLNENQEGKI